MLCCCQPNKIRLGCQKSRTPGLVLLNYVVIYALFWQPLFAYASVKHFWTTNYAISFYLAGSYHLFNNANLSAIRYLEASVNTVKQLGQPPGQVSWKIRFTCALKLSLDSLRYFFQKNFNFFPCFPLPRLGKIANRL